MTRLIGPARSSFIPGRLSSDNIVVVQEAVHSMRRKKGRKGWMLLKLDLEKAYDRIRWDFLKDTLKAAGFSEWWITCIMQCVVGPDMSVLWNGEKTEVFKPLRGLRQGDPLSPYLFVLCMERLCHLIDAEVGAKAWKPISLSRGGLKLSHICFADDLILFAEASVKQIRVIRRVLERFCLASGQKVSLEKSKIFFSDNVSRDLCKLISDESRIKATQDLGRYLGMPILQKRINKETFGIILERMSSKLAGWKGRMLSLAGRITLIKSVLSSIPVHSMSTIKLPASTLSKLDKISRDFLWGSSAEKRKIHLVSWKTVCRPKRDGGLGIRTACDMNKALLAKLGWRLLHDQSGLWAGVLRSKYKVGDLRDQNWIVAKSNWLSTWRSVGIGLREVVLNGYSWVIGDGKNILFWRDKWLADLPLMDTATQDVPAEYERLTARDLWRNGSGWDFGRISPFVSENKRLEMAAFVLDTVTGARDRLAWGETWDGLFTVKSAYAMLTRDDSPRQNMGSFYDRLWRVTAPERVRVFLWSAKEVWRRSCMFFGIRDCPAMAGIWSRIVPISRRRAFFSKSLLEWLYDNLSVGGGAESEIWPTMFAMGIWWSWKWRCGNLFGENRVWRDRVRFIKDRAKEVLDERVANGGASARPVRVEKLVGWVAPVSGWCKLNTDGASHGNPGMATAGGVLRNEEGGWCGGFALNIGRYSAPLAELWGVYYGLYIAWEQGITRLELEVNSKMVVDFLTTGIGDSHPLEANRLADGLANYAFTLPLGFHSLSSAPPCVDLFMREDASGSVWARQVPL
ncbi:Reverse transcriptase domain [Arabidopsis thaliana x Arabidopsis arenosa]|uniref:Reverse transcriptase domain n=1 Tax=Arabidopsis thaliana x Arabidopsis arenosa TaxID=1240361 RepID=A0A8T1Z185_9BRAS|nr:Reverse transcriptase domain [Arabidopsis thaliana x Arabidopsis arenosa]